MNIFSNPSVSALIGGFAGAFFAFLLVQLVEYTKTRKKMKQLYGQLDVLDNQVDKKIEAIRNGILLLRKRKLQRTPLMKFSVHIIRKLFEDLIYKFKADQKAATEALYFRLEATDKFCDNVLSNVEKLIQKLRGKDKIPAELEEELKIIEADYIDILKNLITAKEYIEYYRSKEFNTIINKRYTPQYFQEKIDSLFKV